MNRATFRRRRVPGAGWAATSTLVAALLVSVSAPALAQTPGDKYDRMRDRQTRESLFRLFAEPILVLDVNQYQCGLRNQGDTCVDIFNSPTGGGGFWPTGSPNQYMFNSGINLAGIIPADADFAWAGDTTGAYFFDASGDQQVGEGLTNIYNSLDPDDLANWPCATEGDAMLPESVTGPCTSIPNFETATAFLTDESIFESVLIGRKVASQQDSWLLYWEGNPALGGGVRDHPMGITVEQRTMAWNFPEGNEATIYTIYKFTNVTDNPYFQRLNEQQYFGGEDGLPDEGWQIDSIYVSFDVDPDVTNDYDKNYSTAVLPFNMGVAYEGEFDAPEFTYFPSLFRPPFFPTAPGLVGVKYLKSPVDAVTGEEVGLTLFTVHENPSSSGVQFRDPAGVKQLWRYLSGNIRPSLGDPPCTFSNPKERRLCFLAQTPKDTRFLQASGPFSLGPGESQTVVVAQFAAATVKTDLIELGNTNANAPGVPSLRPGCGTDPIRPIEVGAGWVATPSGACIGTDVVDEFQVDIVPGSLLGKGLTAQTIFNGKFVLPSAPEPPPFYLVPGSDQVTVVWERSATDSVRDPFFEAASDPESELFNPNYRPNDVEGYRVYRGSSPDQLQLIAQFDKAGTSFKDVNCETDPTFLPGADCPGWGMDGIPGTADDDTVFVDIVDPFVQYPAGGIVELVDGSPFVTKADTAGAARVRAGNARLMTNTGIPYAFVDNGVRNGFQYFYQVRAFDVNSLKSGPTSLESSSATKTSFPQAPASDLTSADFSVGLIDRDGNVLTGEPPEIDPETGTFSGPAAPTDNLVGSFLPFAPQLLSSGTFEVRVDSIVPGYYAGLVYFTLSGPGISTESVSWDIPDLSCDAEGSCVYEVLPISVPSEPDSRQDLIDAGIEAPPTSGQLTSVYTVRLAQWHAGDSDWAYQVPGFWDEAPPERALDGGSRWFSGENESMADPTLDLAHGELDGVDAIFEPVPYQGVLADPATCGAVPDHMRRMYQSTWPVRRAADMKLYWGSAGVDSVIDVTHNLPVRFSEATRASYGFRSDADGNGTVDFVDFWYTPGLEDTPNIGCAADGNPSPLAQQPVLQPVDIDGDRAADGQGFALYIAGEPYIFQTSSIPSGTVWTLRTYSGIAGRENGVYTFEQTPRTAGVPGLRFALAVTAPATIAPATADLKKVHTVPDPYYAVSQFDLGPATKNLRFVNLPARATIRIYSLSGVLVDVINHDDVSGGGQETWDVRNRSNQFVASGIYFFVVTAPTGEKYIGKFTIVNFAN